MLIAGIPATSPARTLIDLAAVEAPRRTERALDNCLARKLVTLDALRAATLLLARRGRPGIALMRQLLDEHTDGYVAPEGGLEARALEIIRLAGLPEPVRQLDLGDDDGWIGRVDLAYPDRRLILEVDSGLHHTTLMDRRADEVRDQRMEGAGWRVERITEPELLKPFVLAGRLKGVLADTAP